MKKPVISALVLLVAACAGTSQPSPDAVVPAAPPSAVFGSRPPTQLPAPVARAAPADGFEVRMQRNACYGICPAYELVLHGNGEVDFHGIGHVAVSGAQHGQADAQALAALRAQLS